MTLWLIRHAETAWNRERRYQGHADVPLAAEGLAQARLLAARLARERARLVFGRLWSSDLRRAAETAEALGRAVGLPVTATPLLREMNFGRWEGRTRAEIEALFPENYAAYRADPISVAPVGGESFLDVLERARLFLRCSHSCPARRQLVVGHGATLKAVLIAALGLPPEERSRLVLANASVTVLALGSRAASLLVANDVAHLQGEESARELCRL